jgi:hypothetical protein
MQTRLSFFLINLLLFLSCNTETNKDAVLSPGLRISGNNRYLITEGGEPFFWLGDTGWLLFTKLNREDAEKYFEDRRRKGFNVIQVMVIQNARKAVNIYGDSALINKDIERPFTTTGNSVDDPLQYDYWDHIDYMINLAKKKGLYLALVPLWGSNVRNGSITGEKAEIYADWLANRYKDVSNVIWLNGGDIKGSDSTAIWQTVGTTIHRISPKQLITFHPFGRTQSSQWFHNEKWLDFNMFQSGHRRYDQDTLGLCYGEDNWKYVLSDYIKIPVKPTIDGEPSYEGIPQGLHDPTQPYWTDSDVRRYAYWSVFAGACGFTYGNNAVMQFHNKGDSDSAYGVKEEWDEALQAPGAAQMKNLVQLIMSGSYFDRVPAQDLIAGNQGERYDYLVATKGRDFAFIYTCNGSNMNVNLDSLHLNRMKASWYNPRNGIYTKIGSIKAKGIRTFDPPGEKADGNDWVLILNRI